MPGEALKSLPNIGEEMERCLVAAGIVAPADLRALGSIEAALRVNPHRRSGPVCRSALSALEGAVRGVRWHAIPKGERDALWERYQERLAQTNQAGGPSP